MQTFSSSTESSAHNSYHYLTPRHSPSKTAAESIHQHSLTLQYSRAVLYVAIAIVAIFISTPADAAPQSYYNPLKDDLSTLPESRSNRMGDKSATNNTAATNPVRMDSEASPLAANALKSLVSVETDLGHGTGFIVTHDGKKYLVTNLHVLNSLKYITFTLMNGETISPTTIEVNQSCDLARVDVSDTQLTALTLETNAPDIGARICVYGDSGGEKVFTRLPGKVLGIGPDKLEVDADFIPGNSGSPIVSSNGSVLGVATYLVMRTSASQLYATGTRFEKPRRFGLRYEPHSDWKQVPTSDLIKQHALLKEVEDYLVSVLSIMICWHSDQNLKKLAQAYFESCVTHPATRHYSSTRWTGQINIFADRYARYWTERLRYRSNMGSTSSAQVMLGSILIDLASHPSQTIASINWASPSLQNQASYYNECIMVFTEESSAITKRAGWDKCVIEGVLNRNRREPSHVTPPQYPFLYGYEQ